MKIFAVDDERHILELIRYNLRLDGHQVRTCDDTTEAIKRIKSWKPEVVLLDIMMPGIDGLELCAQLKGDCATKHIKVLMLTAKAQIGNVEDALRLGADYYVTKPFEPKKLSEAIWRHA